MNLIKLLLFILVPIAGFSQIQGEDEVYLSGDTIDAKFNGGGLENFHAYIDTVFDYSKVTKAGSLITSFTINIKGKIQDIRVLKFPNEEAAAEIIRVLQISPKWEPAKRNGKPISITIKHPMVFKSKS